MSESELLNERLHYLVLGFYPGSRPDASSVGATLQRAGIVRLRDLSRLSGQEQRQLAAAVLALSAAGTATTAAVDEGAGRS